jgi:hypothetical protein
LLGPKVWSSDSPLVVGALSTSPIIKTVDAPVVRIRLGPRPWPECASVTALDTSHGFLKIEDPLCIEFDDKHVDRATYYAVIRSVRAESLMEGVIRTDTIHETEHHPWMTAEAPAETGEVLCVYHPLVLQ